jgi:hypothetical protein
LTSKSRIIDLGKPEPRTKNQEKQLYDDTDGDVVTDSTNGAWDKSKPRRKRKNLPGGARESRNKVPDDA